MAQYISPSGKLASERVVVAAPLSYAGSAQRIWKLTDVTNTTGKIVLTVLAVELIVLAWAFVTGWYVFWGILLVPYRLLRRGSRKEKRRALQHREQLEALTAMQHQQTLQTANLLRMNTPVAPPPLVPQAQALRSEPTIELGVSASPPPPPSPVLQAPAQLPPPAPPTAPSI